MRMKMDRERERERESKKFWMKVNCNWKESKLIVVGITRRIKKKTYEFFNVTEWKKNSLKCIR